MKRFEYVINKMQRNVQKKLIVKRKILFPSLECDALLPAVLRCCHPKERKETICLGSEPTHLQRVWWRNHYRNAVLSDIVWVHETSEGLMMPNPASKMGEAKLKVTIMDLLQGYQAHCLKVNLSVTFLRHFWRESTIIRDKGCTRYWLTLKLLKTPSYTEQIYILLVWQLVRLVEEDYPHSGYYSPVAIRVE